MPSSPLTLVVTNNQSPSTDYTLNEAQAIKYSTILPGGCASCSFTLPTDFIPTSPFILPPYLGLNYKLRVFDRQGCVWIGRMEDFGLDISDSGAVISVSAVGYARNLSDQHSTSYNLRNTLSTDAIVSAITTLAPQISQVTIDATGYTFTNTADISESLVNAAYIVTMATQFGDASNAPMLYYVYPDDNGTVRMTVTSLSTTSDLSGSLSDFDTAHFKLAGRAYANRVTVAYNNDASFATVNNSTLQGVGPNGAGFVKELALHIPEFANSADATQIANTLLTWASALRMSANGSFTTGGQTMFRDDATGFHTISARRVRAGQIFKLNDILVASAPGTNIALNDTFVIAGTEWDEDTQQLSITPESFEVSADRAWAQVRSLLMGRFRI